MAFFGLSYWIVILLNLCCTSFTVGLTLLIFSILVKSSFTVKFFAYFLIFLALLLCVLITFKLFKPLFTRRFDDSCLNASSARQTVSSLQMDSPPSYEEVVRNPSAFPKTDQLTANSYSIVVTNTTQSRISCCEAEGTRESHYVDLHSHTDPNITLTRDEQEEENLPPSYRDVVFWPLM